MGKTPLPLPDIDTANHAGIRVVGYSAAAMAARDNAWTIAVEAQEAYIAQLQSKWEHHARQLTAWRHVMSYNDSYFGEPAGLVKQITTELDRLCSPRSTEATSQALRDVVSERRRQIFNEGFSPSRDDAYVDGELARAAACYAEPGIAFFTLRGRFVWPWDRAWWKPERRREDLVKAAALLIAEIERRDRAMAAPARNEGG